MHSQDCFCSVQDTPVKRSDHTSSFLLLYKATSETLLHYTVHGRVLQKLYHFFSMFENVALLIYIIFM